MVAVRIAVKLLVQVVLQVKVMPVALETVEVIMVAVAVAGQVLLVAQVLLVVEMVV